MRLAWCAMICLAGPVSAQVERSQREQVVTTPPEGALRVASAGEPIWTMERTPVLEESAKGIRLSRGIKIGNLMKGQITIPQNSTFTERPSAKGVVACTKLNMAFGKNKPCLFDEDSDGVFEGVAFKLDAAPDPLPQKVSYDRFEDKRSDQNGNIFRSTITYLGSSGASLSLGYREFVNDMARPAFTEDMSVPLESTFPQDIRAKGVTFRINKINGMGLSYSVLGASPPAGS